MNIDTNTQETLIAQAIVDDALKAGLSVTIFDGEEYMLHKSKERTSILRTMRGTDMDTLTFYDNGERVGSVWLIYGNGCDLICDYTAQHRMDELLERANRISDDFRNGRSVA